MHLEAAFTSVFMYSSANAKIILHPNFDIDVVRNPARNTPGMLIICRNPLGPVFPLGGSGSRKQKTNTAVLT